MNGGPYIYAPNAPEKHPLICVPCIDESAPQEVREEQEANARLLAAAPDLYRACQAAAAYLSDPASPFESNRKEADRIIMAALALAEGGSI